jgi:hypothetical protein
VFSYGQDEFERFSAIPAMVIVDGHGSLLGGTPFVKIVPPFGVCLRGFAISCIKRVGVNAAKTYDYSGATYQDIESQRFRYVTQVVPVMFAGRLEFLAIPELHQTLQQKTGNMNWYPALLSFQFLDN